MNKPKKPVKKESHYVYLGYDLEFTPAEMKAKWAEHNIPDHAKLKVNVSVEGYSYGDDSCHCSLCNDGISAQWTTEKTDAEFSEEMKVFEKRMEEYQQFRAAKKPVTPPRKNRVKTY